MKKLVAFLKRLCQKPTLSDELKSLESSMGYRKQAFLKDKIWEQKR